MDTVTLVRFAAATAAAMLLTGAAIAQDAPSPFQSVGGANPNVPGCGDLAAWRRVREVVERSALTGAPAVSVAVMCKGVNVFDHAAGDAHAYSVFRLASVTKPVTAAMILKLVEEGRLSLDDRLSTFLPDFPGADGITLRQLVTHTSGLADFTEDASYPAHKARPHTTAEMLAWIASLKPATRFAPGAGWAYSNSGYVLLGAVIEKVTGQPLEQAYERLLVPARAPSVAFDRPGAPLSRAQAPGLPQVAGHELLEGFRRGPDGKPAPAEAIDMSIPGAAGGLRGTAIDFARLADAIFMGRVLSPSNAARMGEAGLLADGRTNRWGMPDNWREGLQADYGLGVFIDDRTGRRRWWHAGDIDGFHTWVAHFPAEQVTIVILRNSESGNPMETEIQDAVLAGVGQ